MKTLATPHLAKLAVEVIMIMTHAATVPTISLIAVSDFL
jgi:hypothetical protein